MPTLSCFNAWGHKQASLRRLETGGYSHTVVPLNASACGMPSYGKGLVSPAIAILWHALTTTSYVCCLQIILDVCNRMLAPMKAQADALSQQAATAAAETKRRTQERKQAEAARKAAAKQAAAKRTAAEAAKAVTPPAAGRGKRKRAAEQEPVAQVCNTAAAPSLLMIFDLSRQAALHAAWSVVC